MKGMLPLYSTFIHDLRRDRKNVARLQALGRIEEYLTKCFALTIYRKSDCSVFPLTNLGNRGEPKIDIALLEGDLSHSVFIHGAYKKDARIRAFVEIKYLRNRHRIGGSAEDEIAMTLKGLRKQLGTFNKSKHAGYAVDLRGGRKDIYGVVFASYLRAGGESVDETSFKHRVLQRAGAEGFCWHDLHAPYLHEVYAGQKIIILKRPFYASLYHGIWRLR